MRSALSTDVTHTDHNDTWQGASTSGGDFGSSGTSKLQSPESSSLADAAVVSNSRQPGQRLGQNTEAVHHASSSSNNSFSR